MFLCVGALVSLPSGEGEFMCIRRYGNAHCEMLLTIVRLLLGTGLLSQKSLQELQTVYCCFSFYK